LPDNDRLLCKAGFPFNLVIDLKNIKSLAMDPVAGLRQIFLVTAITSVCLQGLPVACADSSGQPRLVVGSSASQADEAGARNVSASEEASIKSHETSKQSEPIAPQSEEVLLTRALQDLKENCLPEAITNLCHLKDAYPDNDDYLLLYRTALRRKNSSDADSQKWYSYVRSLDKQEEERHAFLDAAKDALNAPAAGRINELKRATWLVLTTGKHKSANAGRLPQQQLK
jgi:hypothetical protein